MQQPSDRFSRPTRPSVAFGLIVVLAGLAACTPRTNVQGNVVDPDLLSQIKPGEIKKEEVQALIGTPSSVSPFDQNTWYYISKSTRRFAFLKPEILEQKVIEIEFDKKGMVTAIHKFGEQDGKDVQVVERTTPTRGKSLGMFDQLWSTLLHQVGNGGDASARDPFMRR
jgi:outer membrane protein assembly factor BamE (lipoprotein component of BamABCDE complex)